MLLIVRDRIRNCWRKEKGSKEGRGIVIGWRWKRWGGNGEIGRRGREGYRGGEGM